MTVNAYQLRYLLEEKYTMKSNPLSVITVLLLSTNVAFSQTDLKNAVFIELGGNAYYYSINYERQSTKGRIGRIGVGYCYNTFIIPITVGKIYGNKQHYFEIAGGIDLAKKSERINNIRITEHFIAITGFIGYRYQKPEKNFFLKAGFTPIWQVYESNYRTELTDKPIYQWAGLGLGSRF